MYDVMSKGSEQVVLVFQEIVNCNITLWSLFLCSGYGEDEEQARCWDHHKKEKE